MNALNMLSLTKISDERPGHIRAGVTSHLDEPSSHVDEQSKYQTARLDLTATTQAYASLIAPGAVCAKDSFLDDIRAFRAFGKATVAEIKDGIPYFTNAFWSSDQRAGSSLHQVPYRGCFKPSLTEFVIGRLSNVGDIVHDPFAGRGTVPLQAALMGRCSFGSDINPLFPLMTRPRLKVVRTEDIFGALNTIDWSAGKATRQDLFDYFEPSTLMQIESLRLWLAIHAPLDGKFPDPAADWIQMIALSRLTGHSSGFFSVKTLPPGQMTTIAGQKRMNERYGRVPEAKDLRHIISSKATQLLRDGCVKNDLPHRLEVSSAWSTPWIRDAEVNLVVTSPPFADVIDYGHSNWMRAWFAGFATADIAFSHHRSLEDWSAMIRRTLLELVRVVKPGGYVALEVGEIRNGSVDLAALVWKAATGLPCDRIGVIVHDADFTKASRIFGVMNREKGTNTNRIVILRRQ